MSETTSFVIDNDLRSIKIPDDFVLGVYHDSNVNTIHFVAPKKYKNIDLSEYSIQINYRNNSNGTYIAIAENIIAGTDSIEFDWTAGMNAFIAEGTTCFNVCFRKTDGNGHTTNELNTTVYQLKVLKGLEVESSILPADQAYDFIAQITSILEKTSAYATQLGDLTTAITDTKNAASEASASAKAAANSAATAATIAGVGEFAYYIADDGLHFKYKSGGINS
jgi:hypothetical protein